ncbi:hypothetical protein [Bythopirellula polymerisocia]|uniref:hypothetical protein n=1 Tax=Bythopirellula polymerisocia TaxID=2528003 RepID=UPI0011B5F761|nr:hypothetical protein [Bythopirellula polymerisocia]
MGAGFIAYVDMLVVSLRGEKLQVLANIAIWQRESQAAMSVEHLILRNTRNGTWKKVSWSHCAIRKHVNEEPWSL